MRNPLIAQEIFNTPLLIHPNKLDAIIYGLQDRFGVHVDKPEPGLFTTQQGERKEGGYRIIDGVGVLDIFGALAHRGGIEADSTYILGYQDVARQFEAAINDINVNAVLLNIDSPGGSVSGCFDLADKIYEARGTKPIIAMASDTMTSAAYAIGSAADEVYVSRTSNVGSIGVVMRHVDWSKMMENDGVSVTYIFAGDHKVDGNPYEPLPDSVKDSLQADINNVYELFVETISRNRDIKAEDVRETQAQVYLGQEAIGVGLADGVSTPDKLISRLAAENRGAGSHLTLNSNKEDITMADEATKKVEAKDDSTKTVQAKSDEPVNIDAAVAEARTEERLRILGIMECKAAVGRQSSAFTLATDTDLTVEAANNMLSKMPVEAKGDSVLDKVMSVTDQPDIGAEGGAATEMTAAEQIINDHKLATGKV